MPELTNEELIKENEQLKADNTILTEQNDKALEVIKELKAKLEAAESAPKAQFPTAKVGKDTYEVVIPSMNIGGTIYTAAEVAKDADLLKKLVESKSEALRKKV